MSLTLDGGPNLISSAVTITQVDATTYEIDDLAPLTALDGDYALTVSAAGFVDTSGNMGSGAISLDWTLNTVGPTIASLQGVSQSPAVSSFPPSTSPSPSRSTRRRSLIRTSPIPRPAGPT